MPLFGIICQNVYFRIINPVMQKFNLHVLTLLGALVFCVGLINMASTDGNGASGFTQSTDEPRAMQAIPTLSATVYQYHQEFKLPVVEQSSTNEYLELIKRELVVSQPIAQKIDSPVEVVEKKDELKKPVVATSPKKKPSVEKKKDYVERWALVTAYCPCSKCCGYGTPGRTSIGKSAWKPGIAADPRAVPYGTEIYVKGYGRRFVDDTGGAMRRSWRRKGILHLDIRMTYHYNAKKWGRKMMKVRIYNKK